MLSGTYDIPKVQEESTCRTTKDYHMTELGIYQIHSNALMSEIPFEESKVIPEEIDDTFLINDDETKPDFETTLDMQNYITARYVGRAQMEWYDKDEYTKMGRQFILVCRKNMCTFNYRYFGTEDAIHDNNRNANALVKLPGGGEQ